MDNVDTWVWVLIAVVALLLLLGLIWALTKGRKAKEQHRLEKEREHREEAARLREEAREATVNARQTEAGAAAARADAEQARLDAERLEQRAGKLEHEATEVHQHAEHHITKADKIDPDVTTDKHGNVTERRTTTSGDDANAGGDYRETRTEVTREEGFRAQPTDRDLDDPNAPR
jgi:FtsZ-interacting cell division protein ZipA